MQGIETHQQNFIIWLKIVFSSYYSSSFRLPKMHFYQITAFQQPILDKFTRDDVIHIADIVILQL